MDPRIPAAEPQPISVGSKLVHSALQALFSTIRLTNCTSPTMQPPMADAIVPPTEIPPFVPAGTVLKVVMRTGGELDRMPNSEASVSPRQQANWLERALRGTSTMRCETRTPESPTRAHETDHQRQRGTWDTSRRCGTRQGHAVRG